MQRFFHVTHHRRTLSDSAIGMKKKTVLENELTEMRGKFIADHYLSIYEYINKMCFGPTGYYTTGKVKFMGDFVTHATDKGLAAAFAFQLYSSWQKQRNPSDKKHSLFKKLFKRKSSDEKSSPFQVLECGAGNGDLCFNILTIINKMAKQSPKSDWGEFQKCIKYNIVEISPALVKRQKEKNKEFKTKLISIKAMHKIFLK